MPVSGTSGAGTAVGLTALDTQGEVRFTLLGPLEVVKDGVDHSPTAPKVLQLLAMLVVNPGRVVPVDAIVDELWGSRPPRSVRTTMQTYVYHLRRCIEQNGLAEDAETMLATRPRGYVLQIAPEQVDVEHFRVLARDGRTQVAAGHHAEAASRFTRALDLWAGPPLANVDCGPVLTRHVIDLQEQLRDVRHLRIEAEIACGAHRELVGELRSLTAADSLDEDLHGQLIRVLARSGRRSEAMTTYRQLRARLVDELGVEPSGELQNLHLDLLSDAG